MREAIYLLFHLLTTMGELIKPGRTRAVIAENLLLKPQLIPMSYLLVERLIGSIRRELIDHTLFWTATDLDNKLRDYQAYYNEHRCHASRDGVTPIERDSKIVVDINKYRWEQYCRGLFQLPAAT
jgi:hypothetical protein